jgi:hypothetical protein
MALSRGPTLQPSVWVSYLGVTASIWSNILLTSEPDRQRLSAFEPELAYDFESGRLRLEPRLTFYWMRDLPEATLTAEAGLEVAVYLLGPISIVNSHQLDVVATPGAYYGTVGLRAEQRLHRFRLGTSVGVGYATAPFNNTYFGVRAGALDLFEAGLNARFELGRGFYVGGDAGLSTLVSSALRSASSEPTLEYVGVLFGFER